MRHLVFVILVGSVACTDIQLAREDREVIGGDPTTAGEFPATGALMLRGNGGGAPDRYVGCSGTLIAPTLVLTAAHCVHSSLTQGQVPGFTLKLDGMSALESDIVAGQSATAHPQFNPFGGGPPPTLAEEFDIGVLILASPITGVPYERVVRPTEVGSIAAGSTVDIVGYGFTVEQSLDHYGVKHDATTHIVDVAANEVQIASPGEAQNCQGDSGGPALLAIGNGRRLISVVSRGTTSNANDCSQGGIHSRVDPHLGWIHEQAELPCGSGLSADCAGGADAGADPGGPDAGGPSAGEDAGGGGGNADGHDEPCGGCQTATGGTSAGLWLCLGALWWIRRRR